MRQRHVYILILFGLLAPLNTNKLAAQDIKSLRRAMLDMVYVPQQDRFYAINSVYDNPTKSMLYRINPYSATIEDSTQVGYFIRKLAVTDDGQFLYIAERGTSIYRFDLALKKVVLTMRINKTRPRDSLFVEYITTVPQTPNSVAVVADTYTPNSLNTILLYENDVVVATSGGSSEFDVMVFGKNPNILYTYDAGSSGEGLLVLERQGASLQIIRSYSHSIGTFAGDIKIDEGGFLYGTGGPFRLKLIGDFPEKDGQWKPELEPNAQTSNVRPLFQSDPLSNVVYALSSEYVSSTGYEYYLSAFSKSNYLLLKKTLLPRSVPFEYVRKLTHWGTGKIAGFDSKQVIFVRDCTPSVATPPTIEQGLIANVCPDSSVILSVSGSFSNYFWTTGDTTRSIKINYPANTSPLSVAVSVATSPQGCLSPYSASVTIQPQYRPAKPIITTNNILTVCQGDSVFALAANQATNNDFLWSNGAKGSISYFKNSGIYTVKAISTEGCSSPSSDPISVTIRPDLSPPRPTITITGDTALCAGDSVRLSTNLGFARYEWYGLAASTASITVRPDFRTTYGVRVTTSADCKSDWSNPITVNTYTTPIKPIITANLNCMATQVVAEKYQWFWNNTLLQGANLQFNLAQQRGGYTVKAINGRCASLISEVVNY